MSDSIDGFPGACEVGKTWNHPGAVPTSCPGTQGSSLCRQLAGCPEGPISPSAGLASSLSAPSKVLKPKCVSLFFFSSKTVLCEAGFLSGQIPQLFPLLNPRSLAFSSLLGASSCSLTSRAKQTDFQVVNRSYSAGSVLVTTEGHEEVNGLSK